MKISEEKLRHLVKSTFGEDAVKDKDIMRLYRECLNSAVEEVLESREVSKEEIEDEAKHRKTKGVDYESWIEAIRWYKLKISRLGKPVDFSKLSSNFKAPSKK